MKEIWRDIKGYEGLYQVSDLGRVKSLKKEWVSGNGSLRKHDELIMKQTEEKSGYMSIKLCKNGVFTRKKIHRLVAENFLANTNDYPQINHKDGDKRNNKVNNLEWITSSGNIHHAIRNNLINLNFHKEKMSRIGKMQKGKNNFNWKGYVNIYDNKNKFIIQCETLKEVVEWIKENTRYKNPSMGNICTYIKKHKKIYGFVFKYEDEIV